MLDWCACYLCDLAKTCGVDGSVLGGDWHRVPTLILRLAGSASSWASATHAPAPAPAHPAS